MKEEGESFERMVSLCCQNSEELENHRNQKAVE